MGIRRISASRRRVTLLRVVAILLGILDCSSLAGAQEPLQFIGFYRTAAALAQNAPQSAPQNAPAIPPQVPFPTGPLDPPYLSQMPAVEHVTQLIQGSDPTDTLARQAAVFALLPHIIERMQPPNRYLQTPDEKRVMYVYNLASYRISQSFSKSHTPEETKAFNELQGRYEMDQPLYEDIISRVFSPEVRDVYQKMSAANQAHYQAHVDQITRQNENAKEQAAPSAQGQSQFARNDAGTLAARRCVELGGSPLECVGKGFTTGLMDMAGVNSDALKEQAFSGLVMTGRYTTENGMYFSFGGTSTGFGGCGKLVEDLHAYTIEKRGDHFLLHIKSESQPFVLDLGPGGKLAGPGPMDITGRIIVGYHKYYEVKRRVRDNSIVPGSGHEVQVPVYGPKTEHCTVGVFSPRRVESKPGDGVTGTLLEKFVSTQIGPRMSGPYTSRGGLKIVFDDDSAIVDCADAHVKNKYAVENAPTQILLKIQNPKAPFTLMLQPDGTLAGPTTVDVTGRLVTGTRGDDFVFAESHARCDAATMAPTGRTAPH